MALYMLQDDDNHELDNRSCSNQEDLLVMEKFEKEKVSEDVPKYVDREKISSPSTEPTSESGIEKNPEFEFQSKQALIDKQIQFYTLKQEEDMKQQWGRKLNENKQKGNKRRACGGFLGQKTSHGRIKSDMRAVFLDHQTGSRTGCSGTGVFLPRAIDNTTSDSRRKTGCPTVLIPAKVVQALKLHFDKMGSPARTNGINFQAPASQHRQSRAVPPATSDQEMGLPQEWTY
ncbi:uncharacterized protein LOC119991974 isoform X2 [Tripterygium wilfordii]|nr:uncharacterized protein LOC119991974 isoform X2 [Tripterygium wilfordii]